MLFNSYSFLFAYLPVVAVVYFLLAGRVSHNAGRIWLGAASFFFYGYWDARYVPLLAASVLFNFAVGRKVAQKSKPWLIAGVVGNLAALAYFKYMGFFVSSLNAAAGLNFDVPNIVLPLGISFFTFTQIAYLADAYSEKIPAYSLTDYALFVSYFPHLLAGPILHHAQMMPQFTNPARARLDWPRFTAGFALFIGGLAKKVLIADRVAPIANDGFSHPMTLAFGAAWATALAYSVQIYFDFSGYTDMARGISKMLNVELPINFNSPYQARNLQDFWQRWHITLSRFLRDYLFFLVGGARRNAWAPYVATLITFTIAGLWHGANWTFVIWGLLNGIGIVIVRLWPGGQWNLWPARVATFASVTLLWVWFRAATVADALYLTGTMLARDGFTKLKPLPEKPMLLLIVCALAFAWLAPNSQKLFERSSFKPAWRLALGALLALSVASLEHASEFLYFNF